MNFQKDKFYKKLTTGVFYFSILLFIIAFNFSDNPAGGWYQQFLPFLNNRPISDVIFLDSLTGFAVTPYVANDTAYIIKTSNGGDNWNVIFHGPTNSIGGFNEIQFLNLNTGYACGNFFWKTTDAGLNWFNVNTSGIFPMRMQVLNQDTIWLVDSDGLVGGVYRTTNGGASWTRQLSLGTLNPENIYMYNKDIGFISKVNTGAPYSRKTTDGGQSWFVVVNNEGFTDMYFADSLSGWRAYGTMKKTTDGGLSWVNQILPKTYFSQITQFSNVNNDTIWGVNGIIAFPNNQARAIIYLTTNGGNNWGYQIPDTNIHKFQYYHCEFIDKSNGWAYQTSTGIHTTKGGDSTFYTLVNEISSQIPNAFKLNQNYPNPFNPKTKIKFEMSKKGNAVINIHDLRGKLIETIVKNFLTSGEFETEFDGNNYPSGIYFYSLFVDGQLIDSKKMTLIK